LPAALQASLDISKAEERANHKKTIRREEVKRMPKIKTHKSTSKRFRRTKGGKGKLVRTKLGKSHLRRKKSKRMKRLYDDKIVVESKGVQRRVQRLAPYLREK
jgi:large subunit ribosomal protein L35